jgi:hypothetical protein
VAREMFDSLRALALEAVQGPIASRGARSAADASLILDAAFLVAPGSIEDFQRELTSIVARHGSRGFRFDFTGPWPPYHFVRGHSPAVKDDA